MTKTACSSSITTGRSYQAPKLTTLGRWAAVTLIQSVPIGPGGLGLFTGQSGNPQR